jgi:hypothetical protein
MRKAGMVLLLNWVAVCGLQAQPDSTWLNRRSSRAPEWFAMVQLWATWTPTTKVFDPDSGAYQARDEVFDPHIRRSRIGMRGEVLPRLRYTAIFAFDLIGHDPLSGTFGGTNNEPFPRVGVIDAFFQYQVWSARDWLHLTGGFFRPVYSREAITSGFVVNSMEKPVSQIYIRKHLLNSNPGRSMGLNAGGQVSHVSGDVHLRYDLGLFQPVFGGKETYPIAFFGRVVLQAGQPEDARYTHAHRINYFGQRKGLSLGLAAARTGETATFRDSRAYGLDLLLNAGPFQLDGEVHRLERRASALVLDRRVYVQYTGHLRAGYNLWHTSQGVLEPVLSWMFYFGGLRQEEQALATEVGSLAGVEHSLEAGLNWWFSPRVVLQGYYTRRWAQAGHAGPGATVNSYYSQAEIGPILRGDWVGMGLRFIW